MLVGFQVSGSLVVSSNVVIFVAGIWTIGLYCIKSGCFFSKFSDASISLRIASDVLKC